MRLQHIFATLAILATFPLNAQIFNFSLKTNNQQLIDKALDGAFVKINQSYELCDTIKDEHFGRDEKDYFSIIPFIGVETEKGLIFPSASLAPWTNDDDFRQYKNEYKPIVSGSKLSLLNSHEKTVRILDAIIAGDIITERLSILNDSTQSVPGLLVDTVPGIKDGWLIWLSSESDIIESDSVKFNSIKKEIEVPIDGEHLRIDNPDISGTVYGGIYVTPIQKGVGQLAFILTGVMVLDDEGWVLDFPFITAPKQTKVLTPIESVGSKGDLNSLKKKRK